MPYEIVMPRLGWNMEEGTLVEWLKQDGESVNQGETVCTIEGDKAATDIETFESGILKIPHASPSPGKTVPVGTLLGYIVAEQELATFDPNQAPAGNGSGEGIEPAQVVETGNLPAAPGEPSVGEAQAAGSAVETVSPNEQARSRESALSAGTGAGVLPEPDVPAISPRARRAAEAAEIDWRSLKGSGRSGRIVERDVLEAAGQPGHPGRPGQLRQHEPALDGPDGKPVAVRAADGKSTAVQGDLRRVIARRIAEAHRTTAPVTLNTEADVTALSSFLE
jgi:pyruvate dehydrogenase E2 component (dihydrolipoamide acetyltransferase)